MCRIKISPTATTVQYVFTMHTCSNICTNYCELQDNNVKDLTICCAVSRRVFHWARSVPVVLVVVKAKLSQMHTLFDGTYHTLFYICSCICSRNIPFLKHSRTIDLFSHQNVLIELSTPFFQTLNSAFKNLVSNYTLVHYIYDKTNDGMSMNHSAINTCTCVTKL